MKKLKSQDIFSFALLNIISLIANSQIYANSWKISRQTVSQLLDNRVTKVTGQNT